MKPIDRSSTRQEERRKLLLGLGILSLLPLFSFFSRKKKEIISCSPTILKGTARLLTEEGRLVEVDISQLNAPKKKVSDKELMNWIKR